MAFGTFEVLAGDLKKGKENSYISPNFNIKVNNKFLLQPLNISEVESLEEASEENVKRLAGTAGWGLAGAAILGPVGLLAGLLAGGKGKDVVFVCKFKDGRKFLAKANSKLYQKIAADFFELNN